MSKLRWSLVVLVVTATMAMAADAVEKVPVKPKWTGTIRVEGKQTQTRLKQLAKISSQEATRIALAAVPNNLGVKKVTETELEVEHGFLVYSVEIRINGQKGEREVLIDAGTGKVLAQEIEDDDDDEDDDEDEDDDDDDQVPPR